MDAIGPKTAQAMMFVYQALQDGWTVRKAGSKYEFSKALQGKPGFKQHVQEDRFTTDMLAKYADVDAFLRAARSAR